MRPDMKLRFSMNGSAPNERYEKKSSRSTTAYGSRITSYSPGSIVRGSTPRSALSTASCATASPSMSPTSLLTRAA